MTMNKVFCILAGLFICVIVFTFSCTKKSIEQSAGSNYCDTTSVSYQNDVLPIIETYCYPCHSMNNKAFSNGIVLEGFDNLKAWGLSTYLLGDIRHDPGFIGMPYGKPKLSDCSINMITAWINQGFPN